MESSSSIRMKTYESTIALAPIRVSPCSCEKYKILMRASDLADPCHSWIKGLVSHCEHSKRHKNCSCDLVISLPYGYFFPISPSLELGDTRGPKSTYVRIISNDKFRFVIKRKWTRNCLLIDSWFKDRNQTAPGQEAEIFIKKYPSICIHYLCKFLMYKYDYETGSTLPDEDFTVPDQLVFQMLELAHDFIM